MSPHLRNHFLIEISNFRSALYQEKDITKAWSHLERAHVLGQFYVGPHLLVHWYMMFIALRTHRWPEILGQIPRLILAAPGSIFRLAPKGNTGGSNVGIFQPMHIPDDLNEILDKV